MELVLKQLGELLLGSVPTAILLLLLFGVYTFVVHRPLQRILAERRSKTEGAAEEARAGISAAEARAAEYDQRLREARQAIYQRQEAKRIEAQQHRAQKTAEARSAAQGQIAQAKAQIESDKIAAQGVLQGESARLASEVIRTVLQPAGVQPQIGGQ
ncbi:MAG TPA: ATP synthase F0 subunit B [Terriglobales bacterium]|jgi:F-type H+-transporting ATPase subunit b